MRCWAGATNRIDRWDELSRDQLLTIVDSLITEGCEGIIAGCTEIELLVTPNDVTIAYFPTTRIHALAAVDVSLANP